jgi:hypothetical protein
MTRALPCQQFRTVKSDKNQRGLFEIFLVWHSEAQDLDPNFSVTVDPDSHVMNIEHYGSPTLVP